jgi:hypothetical protein
MAENKNSKKNTLGQSRSKRSQAVRQLLDKVEKTFEERQAKATLGDYIRLIQLQRELEAEEPKNITVTWVDPETNPDAESTNTK